MNINVHIERLVLDGLPLSNGQGHLVQVGVEAELSRLLRERGLTGISGGAVPNLTVKSVQLTQDSQPAELGHQIARSIHTGLGSPAAEPLKTNDKQHA